MIKHITLTPLLTILICATAAAQLDAVTIFGTSKGKVNKLRENLEGIKRDYDNAIQRATDLQLQLDVANSNLNIRSAEIDSLRSELNACMNECVRLRELQVVREEQEKKLEDTKQEHTSLLGEFAKQVDRLTEATTKLQELESIVNEICSLPEQIFGKK